MEMLERLTDHPAFAALMIALLAAVLFFIIRRIFTLALVAALAFCGVVGYFVLNPDKKPPAKLEKTVEAAREGSEVVGEKLREAKEKIGDKLDKASELSDELREKSETAREALRGAQESFEEAAKALDDGE